MYILVAIFSYLLNAGVYISDKFLLSKKVHSSIVYAFYVGIWSLGNFVLLFFDPWVPDWWQLAFDVAAGLLFLFTLVFWYKALHQSEATRVVPIVGALTPIFSFLLSMIFLETKLFAQEIIAFILLIAGGVLISVKRTRVYLLGETRERIKNISGNVFGKYHAGLRPTSRLLINSVISAACFAAYFVFIKYIYSHTHQPFIGAFVWSRLGSFIGVLIILAVPAWRQMIRSSEQKQKRTKKQLAFFLGVRFAAAIAFILLNWAISLGNVSMINALQGTQYVFLLFIVIILARKYPRFINEEIGRGVILQKTIGVILVGIGLYLLVA
ncbi:EamA family transporter [Candidatus Falkowbacteria bacterium]|nr:MAG: EamA family transporter [Candidatus Falkowbacteria bacterium]